MNWATNLFAWIDIASAPVGTKSTWPERLGFGGYPSVIWREPTSFRASSPKYLVPTAAYAMPISFQTGHGTVQIGEPKFRSR
jgi:hypothetical protein